MNTLSHRSQKRKLTVISCADRAEQFKDDFYQDGNLLFCKFCQHSVEYTRVHT